MLSWILVANQSCLGQSKVLLYRVSYFYPTHNTINHKIMTQKEEERHVGESERLLIGESTRLYDSSHRLGSLKEGRSQVEILAEKIERRRNDRILITNQVRVALESELLQIAIDKNYPSKNRVRRQDLVAYRERVANEMACERRHDAHTFSSLCLAALNRIGVKTTNQCLLEVLDRCIVHIDAIDDDWFHYVEFGFFYTRVVSQWPWMRNQSVNAFMVVAVFFLCTPILFCYVLEDENVCTGVFGKIRMA